MNNEHTKVTELPAKSVLRLLMLDKTPKIDWALEVAAALNISVQAVYRELRANEMKLERERILAGRTSPSRCLTINNLPSDTDRLLLFFVREKKIIASVTNNAQGTTKSGDWCEDLHEQSVVNLTAPATRQGWYTLQRYLRLNFSPFTYTPIT
jgi:hypothetical protein